jgi:hypothetical protein
MIRVLFSALAGAGLVLGGMLIGANSSTQVWAAGKTESVGSLIERGCEPRDDYRYYVCPRFRLPG